MADIKICLVVEGAYPYVQGGVSSWINTLMNQMPHYEFVIQTIAASYRDSGKFKYKFPPNMTDIRECFLENNDIVTKKGKKIRLNKKEREAIRSLLFRENEDWAALFNFFQNNNISVNDLLMGKDFYQTVQEFYREKYPRVVFTDFLWTVRSIFLPLFMILKSKFIEADIYHSISTGYAGIVACCAGHIYNKPVMLTEHGIYTREREEEIIRASWTKGIYKDLWNDHFYMLSNCIYNKADRVFALFDNARKIQIEIGCPEHKTETIHNGVDLTRFNNIGKRDETDPDVNIGAIVRVTPIKDIKTLINSFHQAKSKMPELKLYIIGNTDEDPGYYEECVGLIELLGAKDVIFTGHVNISEYLGRMDMIILTSISEGQPLSTLEAMAAGKACIATNVGDCLDMLHAEDEDNRAGIVVPVMNVTKIAQAMLTLGGNPELRKKMGENGKLIVQRDYDLKKCIGSYNRVYREVYESSRHNIGFAEDIKKIDDAVPDGLKAGMV